MDHYVKHEYHWNVWNKLFRKSFLDQYHFRFADMRLAEDQVFCFSALFHAARYVIVPGSYYIYRIANESLSRGVRKPAQLEKYLSSMLNCIDAMAEITRDIPFFQEHPEQRQRGTEYILDVLEMAFVAICYQEVGKEAVKKDGAVRRVFEEYFGDMAYFPEYLFYQSQDRREKAPDIFGAVNSIHFWRKYKAASGKGPVDLNDIAGEWLANQAAEKAAEEKTGGPSQA